MNEETKQIIRPLIESVASLTEKQAVILQLLSVKLDDLTETEKETILNSAKGNEKIAKELRQSLQAF